MQQINWSTYKFHPHTLPTLMTESRSKSEVLSQTTKSKLEEIWISETFQRRNYAAKNKYTFKGIEVESDSLALLSKIDGRNYFKNIKTLENDLLIGTPDLIKPHVIDIKSSWDVFTFFGTDYETAKKSYFWQLVGYMILTNTEKAELVYALVDTPEEIAQGELYRMSYYLLDSEVEEARANYIFGDIPENLRIRRFEFSAEENDFDKVKNRLADCRIYLSELQQRLNY